MYLTVVHIMSTHNTFFFAGKTKKVKQKQQQQNNKKTVFPFVLVEKKILRTFVPLSRV